MAVDVLLLDALHHVFELGDGRPDQRRLGFVPVLDRLAQQLARLLGQSRQHGGQVDGQLAEQIQGDGADVLQLLRPCPDLCAASTARAASTYGLARSASSMISRMARL